VIDRAGNILQALLKCIDAPEQRVTVGRERPHGGSEVFGLAVGLNRTLGKQSRHCAGLALRQGAGPGWERDPMLRAEMRIAGQHREHQGRCGRHTPQGQPHQGAHVESAHAVVKVCLLCLPRHRRALHPRISPLKTLAESDRSGALRGYGGTAFPRPPARI